VPPTGFGGQSFQAHVLPKVRALRDRYPSLDIQMDGGINAKTVGAMYQPNAHNQPVDWLFKRPQQLPTRLTVECFLLLQVGAAAAAGANVLVAGSAVFGSETPGAVIRLLRDTMAVEIAKMRAW
jgi:ribulose-phosphate 3-epimerase